MANPKKRKDVPQGATLLDFFGGGSAGPSSQHNKKQKAVKATKSKIDPSRSKVVPQVKREVGDEFIVVDSSDDVIILDSSDDDDIVEVSAIRPAPKPMQATAESRNRTASSSCSSKVGLGGSVLAHTRTSLPPSCCT